MKNLVSAPPPKNNASMCDTNCFLSTSTKPALVSALPVTACLKVSMTSSPMSRLGAFEGLVGAGLSVLKIGAFNDS